MTTTKSAGDRAASLMEGGYICTQAVLFAYWSDCGIETQALSRLGTGFGAGLGRIQSTCGALTGGIAVLGLARGSDRPGDKENKEQVYRLVNSLVNGFRAELGATDCRGVLGAPITTPEEVESAEADGLFEDRCGAALRFVCARLDEFLADPRLPEGARPAPGALEGPGGSHGLR